MFLGVDFEFAKIVKGGRRAKLDSELLSLPATPGKDRLQAALPFIESFRYFFSLQDESAAYSAHPLGSSAVWTCPNRILSSTKIVKAPGSAKFICGGSKIILSGADFPAKLRKGWGVSASYLQGLAGRADTGKKRCGILFFRAIMYFLRGIMYGMRETIS